MKWSKEAEKTIQRVPFFIRKRVRKKVEAYAKEQGISTITNKHIDECKQRFVRSMDRELKGYAVETCLGAQECSNRTMSDTDIADKIESFLQGQGMKEFLQERLSHPLKVHNEFRVSISFCPNSCSRPQIVDIGLIGAVCPVVSDDECNGCGLCKRACDEEAISLEGDFVKILEYKCLYCGQCISRCPTGSIAKAKEGFRVLVGGKLGRHPQLGFELPGIFSPERALEIIEKVTLFYKARCKKGERLGVLLAKSGFEDLMKELNLSSGEEK